MPDELRFETEPNALRLDDLVRQDNRSTGAEFGSSLSSALEELDRIDDAPDESLAALLKGDEKDLHSVMMRLNEVDLSLRFALEVRNRLLEAFQEIQRMPL